jgi:hypothetical protein
MLFLIMLSSKLDHSVKILTVFGSCTVLIKFEIPTILNEVFVWFYSVPPSEF